jgi:hypothetical protein
VSVVVVVLRKDGGFKRGACLNKKAGASAFMRTRAERAVLAAGTDRRRQRSALLAGEPEKKTREGRRRQNVSTNNTLSSDERTKCAHAYV